jgi:hypothetical protein
VLHIGIYVREGADTQPLTDLADELYPLLRPKPDEVVVQHREYQGLNKAFGKARNLGT